MPKRKVPDLPEMASPMALENVNKAQKKRDMASKRRMKKKSGRKILTGSY